MTFFRMELHPYNVFMFNSASKLKPILYFSNGISWVIIDIIREKYFRLVVVITGLTVIYFSMAWLLTMLLAKLTTNIPFQQLPVSFKWFQPIRYGIGLPLTAAVLTTIIKLLKNWIT